MIEQEEYPDVVRILQEMNAHQAKAYIKRLAELVTPDILKLFEQEKAAQSQRIAELEKELSDTKANLGRAYSGIELRDSQLQSQSELLERAKRKVTQIKELEISGNLLEMPMTIQRIDRLCREILAEFQAYEEHKGKG